MNRRNVILLTGGAAAAIFVGGAAMYGRSTGSEPAAEAGTEPGTQVAESQPVVQEDAQLIRSHSPVIGPFSAPVTIVEFFDPSCEACRAFYPLLKDLMAKNPGNIRIVLRYTPFHPASEDAVRILEAARKQSKFEPILEALLDRQAEWGADGSPNADQAWAIAAELGLDVTQGKKDAALPEIDAIVAQDRADVKSFKVQGTPTFFVNGKPLPQFGAKQLVALVESELAAAK